MSTYRSSPHRPVPSSLSALVNTLSASQHDPSKSPGDLPSRNKNRKLLKLLFAEYHSVEDSPTADGYNHSSEYIKLIEVVVTEGLSRLVQGDEEDNPFAAPATDGIPEAEKSLEVVRSLIGRRPDLLCLEATCPSEAVDGVVKVRTPSIFVWLLSRLIPALASEICKTIWREVEETIRELFVNFARFVEEDNRKVIWDKAVEYVICSYESILATLNLPRPPHSFHITLPGSAYTKFDSSYTTYPIPIQIHIRNPSSALTVALALLRILSIFALPSPTHPLLDSPTTFLPLFHKLGTLYTNIRNSPSSSIPPILQTLAQLLNSGAAIRANAPQVYTAILNLSLRALGDTIRSATTINCSSTQISAASLLLELLYLAETDPLAENSLRNRILPRALSLLFLKEESEIHNDFKLALLLMVAKISKDYVARQRAHTLMFGNVVEVMAFKEEEVEDLAARLKPLEMEEKVEEDGEPMDLDDAGPRKRRKVCDSDIKMEDHTAEKEEKSAGNEDIVERLFALIGSEGATDVAGLHLIVCDGFKLLNTTKKSLFLKLLGLSACSSAHTLQHRSPNPILIPPSLDDQLLDWDTTRECSFCDVHTSVNILPKTYLDEATENELFRTLEMLTNLDEFQSCFEARIWGIMALRRLVGHSRRHLDLGRSALGRGCVHALQAGVRELRIAAGRTLPAYLWRETEPDVLKRNQRVVVSNLKTLSEMKESYLSETTLSAWGAFARASTGDQLNLALLQLIEYLGHPSTVIIYMANVELKNLEIAFQKSLYEITKPFWEVISIEMVKKLLSQPQIFSSFCALIGYADVNSFLVTTQIYTIPYLVLYRKPEIIQRISDASNTAAGGTGDSEMFKKELLLRKDILAPVLALLLIQDVEDVEGNAEALLNVVSEDFGTREELRLRNFLRRDGMQIAVEVLKASDPENKAKNDRIHKALKVLAKYNQDQNIVLSKRDKRDPEEVQFHNFMDNYVLGLMSTFSDDINKKVQIEGKRQSLRAIYQMITLAGAAVVRALPQICACLQSCLDQVPLRSMAIKAWAAMMERLPEQEISQLQLCGLTFALLLQHWEEFDAELRGECKFMVEGLFGKYSDLLEKNIAITPSLERIAELEHYEKILAEWRKELSLQEFFEGLITRVKHDNTVVVQQALHELSASLDKHLDYIQSTTLSERPDQILSDLLSCLLSSCSRFAHSSPTLRQLLAQSLGQIGAIDPDRITLTSESTQIFILSNFTSEHECESFIAFLLEKKLVKAFLSSTDTPMQGRLAFVMQELMKTLEWNETVKLDRRPRSLDLDSANHRWDSLSIEAKNTLSPFLLARYKLPPQVKRARYPIFKPNSTTPQSYRQWLQIFMLDLLGKAKGAYAERIFGICAGAVKGLYYDIGVANFLLPYVVLNIVISGEEEDRRNIENELLAVLAWEGGVGGTMGGDVRQRCETIFMLVDHLSRWVQEKHNLNTTERLRKARQANRHLGETESDDSGDDSIQRVESFLSILPVDIMGLRSFECGSFPRALFYWEQHIRHVRTAASKEEMEPLYERLQTIYSHIDDPDGIEGLSTKLQVHDMNQQILEHRRDGRWATAQSWYEMKLEDCPGDVETQENLLTCLKEGGMYESLMAHVEKYVNEEPNVAERFLPYAVEAAWKSEDWGHLSDYLEQAKPLRPAYDFSLGKALTAIRAQDPEATNEAITSAQQLLVEKLTPSTTGSLRACHDVLIRLHALSELTPLTKFPQLPPTARTTLTQTLQKRLDLLGSSAHAEKQYLLSLRRTALTLSSPSLTDPSVREYIADLYLTSGKLARKAGNILFSFSSVLHASNLGSKLATIEHARLLWHEGNHRKAIQSLEGAIAAQLLSSSSQASSTRSLRPSRTDTTASDPLSTRSGAPDDQNKHIAKATLLLAKWLDFAGQSHSSDIIATYQRASTSYLRWEQGHYYLGRHYNMLFETEKERPVEKQRQNFLNGEMAKLVCQSYLRAICFGNKYIFQTMPRMLTLWLGLGELVKRPVDERGGNDDFRRHIHQERISTLNQIHNSVKKYTGRIPAYLFYTAFPQILSRITHPHEGVWDHLQEIIRIVVSAYPKVTLWSLMAVCKSTQKDRAARGNKVLALLKESGGKSKQEKLETRLLVSQATKVTEQLLQLSNFEITGKPATVSISRDLRFNRAVAPCGLVMPNQASLTVILPADPAHRKNHSPFPSQQPTIAEFLDEADVMSSLQKPRKVTVRGSDGRLYPFLCKPKDDLRKDARLMEFNTMINRLLKKDSEASRRSLKIRTYCVTPLNEECGLIEWVNNMRPLREILLRLYRQKGIVLNYNEIRAILDDASSSPSKHHLFTTLLLPKFPPIFHLWFIERFPSPTHWFSSRLSYSRTLAVMSIVGHVLGLGDRHGENILFDESTGEALHVDFNCLFDKGLTFDKPERVPFRLTQNMVDALGVTGTEGSFRRSAEVSMAVLRANEETLMTIMETFLYDPAVDMVRRTRKHSAGKTVVPDTPRDVLEVIRGKLRGFSASETVPLSVEGQVQELIRQAVSEENLCKMYIGWMSFF